MTELSEDSEGTSVQHSPDGSRFAATISRGDMTTNERVFTLLIFDAGKVLRHSAPQTLAVIRTRTNSPGISEVRWQTDSTLTFIGVEQRGPAQVYAADLQTMSVRRLTAHPENVVAYNAGADLTRILYRAEAEDRVANDEARQRGFTVRDGLDLDSILAGHFDPAYLKYANTTGQFGIQATFILDTQTHRVSRVRFPTDILDVDPDGFLPSTGPISPDGRFAIVKRLVKPAEKWHWRPKGYNPSGLTEAPAFLRVDLLTGESTLLIDAPAPRSRSSWIWSPDGHSLLLVNAFQLDGDVPKSQPLALELDTLSGRLSTIETPSLNAAIAESVVGEAQLCARALNWTKRNEIILAARRHCGDAVHKIILRKAASGWRETPARFLQRHDVAISITIDQGLNTPPNLKATDLQTGKSAIFTDFNPTFRQRTLATVGVLDWTSADGVTRHANVFIPPDCRRGARLPLVIQTHGYTRDKFFINGFPSGSGYSAQVLANRGIVVLQLDDAHEEPERQNSPEDLASSVRNYESAIDLLDERGLIDRDRVGLQGHSATSIPIVYAIAHPKPRYRYRAALRTGAADFGYVNYIFMNHAARYVLTTALKGRPIGEGASEFAKNALPWHLEDVATPLMTQVTDADHYSQYVPAVWEMHQALQMLHKPSELIVFPDGSHDLVKPWERLTSQQAAVDWFQFWLQEYEDPSGEKSEQYARWRELRKLQCENSTRLQDNCGIHTQLRGTATNPNQ